jgi:hypothetical protein
MNKARTQLVQQQQEKEEKEEKEQQLRGAYETAGRTAIAVKPMPAKSASSSSGGGGGGDEANDDVIFFMRSAWLRSPASAPVFWLGDQLVSWDGNDGLRSALKGSNCVCVRLLLLLMLLLFFVLLLLSFFVLLCLRACFLRICFVFSLLLFIFLRGLPSSLTLSLLPCLFLPC